jgi:indole-3-glycerol phosphate synthase
VGVSATNKIPPKIKTIMILDKIIEQKKLEITKEKQELPLSDIKNQLQNSNIPKNSFIAKIESDIAKNNIAIIAEVKKASPSKGIIREDFDYLEIAKIYENSGASSISVLTDEKFFQGSKEYLTQIKKEVSLPLLRKDFIIDPYQIYQAKLIGADCILLIMSILSEEEAINLEKIAIENDLDVLVEVHNEEELQKALKLQTKLIGINNRNLKNMTININNSINLSKNIPQGKIIICESGISDKDDIKLMQENNINCFLIGELFMRQNDIGKKLQELSN